MNDSQLHKQRVPSPSGACCKSVQPLLLYARSLGAPGEGQDEGVCVAAVITARYISVFFRGFRGHNIRHYHH